MVLMFNPQLLPLVYVSNYHKSYYGSIFLVLSFLQVNLMHLDWSVNEYYLTWLHSFHFPNKKKSQEVLNISTTLFVQNQQHTVVCFAPQKKPTMDTLGQQHSPLRIQRYSISTKYEWEDIVINKNTLISPTAVNFEYNNQESNTLSIGPISEVAPGQLVLVKGHMEHLSATKTVVLQSNPVKKQEVFINDQFGYVKLVLWGNHNDTLTEGSTYLLDIVWVKVINEERYLNTRKNENESTISSVAKFAQTLQPVQNISASKDITANIIGLTNMNSCLTYCSGNKSVTTNGNCNLYQLYHVYEDNQLQPTLVSKDLYSRLNHSRNND